MKPTGLFLFYNAARNNFDSAQHKDTPSFENVLPRKEIENTKF
jgi:hypothetical protein